MKPSDETNLMAGSGSPAGNADLAEGLSGRQADRVSGKGRLKTTATLILCSAFFMLIWMPAVDSIFKLDRSPIPIENRAPAKFPAWSSGLSGAKSYLIGLEAYFNDHFGFRNLFIRTHGFLLRKCFGQGSIEVLIGKDNWLFYAGNGAIDCHLGTRLLTEKQLSNWQSLLQKRQQWLAQRGIKYLFVVAPNKESIYPDYLPDWAHKPGARTELDQLIDRLRTSTQVEVVDLRPALLEARQGRRVYLTTDTHWNQVGAFAAYREIIRNLGKQLPDLEPLPLEKFDNALSQKPGGDLAKMLAQEQAFPEKEFVTVKPGTLLPKLVFRHDPKLLPRQWGPGEEPLVVENPGAKYRAVVFRDSFAEFLAPFLSYHFQRCVYIWQRPWDVGLIEGEKPDVVIDEILERYLDWPAASQ
jgi:alginate O-acetyltransferase complex protein AlgJ